MDLNASHDLITNLTDHLPVGIYRTTRDGKIIYANLALAKILGYSLDEIYNISVKEFYMDKEKRETEINTLLENSELVSSQEISLRTRSGKTILVKDTIKIVKDETGQIRYFDGILEDITEKKQAEQELRESQLRYKTLTEITFEGIIIHNQGIIIDTNPAIQKMIGYSGDDLKGKNIFDFIHPDSQGIAKKNIQNLYSGIYEIKIICKDQRVFKAEIEVKNIEINNKECRVVAIRDTTGRKNIEKEILTLSTAVKQSPASIVITDLNGSIEYVNPKFTEVTGYEAAEVIGKNPNILKTEHTSSEDYKEMWQTISKGKTWTGEFLNKKKDGTNYWELASISPIIDETGNTIKYLAVKEDITERKNIEDALIQSENELLQANATKNVFFSIIAHDLKGPIGNFSQLLNLLKDNFSEISNEEKLDYINILSSLSLKTNNLLDDLLLWARIQMNTLEFSIEKVNIKTLIQNSIDIIEEKAKEKDIKILCNIPDIDIDTNKSSIKTVIRNLLSNAIKFSHRESQIEIKSKLISEQNKLEIAVTDHGVGIPTEDVQKLFKIESSFSTFGTEKEKGTGLGLILCKDLIEKNGGEIWVESTEDAGSTFYFNLPFKKS